MSQAGCGVIIYADVCKNSKFEPGKAEISVQAEKAGTSPTLTGVIMKINIESPARKSLVEAAWRRTEANWHVMFVFKEAVPVKVEAELKGK